MKYKATVNYGKNSKIDCGEYNKHGEALYVASTVARSMNMNSDNNAVPIVEEVKESVIKEISKIVIEAPLNACIELSREEKDKYINGWLWKKEYGEKTIKVTGNTADGDLLELNIRGDYEMTFKY